MNEQAAWIELNQALREYAPPCAGLGMFTADRLTPDELEVCASICAHCPVADPCGAYATAAGVSAGFWAGRHYTPKGIK